MRATRQKTLAGPCTCTVKVGEKGQIITPTAVWA